MKQFYRSVWISDLHLCNRDSQTDAIYSFLDSIHCDYLYLVGDIVDIWALKRRWYWPKSYNEVLHKLLKRSRRGTHVIYIPGNHDELFREFVGYRFGDMEIRSQAIHETADGRRLLVVHGDEFDAIVVCHKWLSLLGAWAYDYLIALNRWVNAARRLFGLPYWSLSGACKRRVKQAVRYVTDFENVLTERARRESVDGIVCGHIHQPALRDLDGVLYANSGDWVENCTALVENPSGKLELIWWRSELDDRCGDMAEAVALPRLPGWAELAAPGPVAQPV